MTKEEINKIEQYFTCYSESQIYDPMVKKGPMVKWLFHKECDNFNLVIFIEDNSVYQAGSEADIIGCELDTFEELVTRFESFTKEKIDNIIIKTYEDEDSTSS